LRWRRRAGSGSCANSFSNNGPRRDISAIKSTITHPATTTHGRITPEARAAAGITEGLVRVAVGLEAVADLKTDLARGLG